MATKKKRDLAQKLLDSLMDEDHQKGKEKQTSESKRSNADSYDTKEIPPTKQRWIELTSKDKKEEPEEPDSTKTNVKVGAGHTYSPSIPSGNTLGGSAEANLAQSENLRIAQQRILDLEEEVERLRRENEALAAAGETLKRRSEELRAGVEQLKSDKDESKRIFDEELNVFRNSLSAKDEENRQLKQKLESVEIRLEQDFKRIRVRERELEHRMELLKMENNALVRNKDEIILDLKRRIDQLQTETENFRLKGQELFRQIEEKNDTLRRVVRALRIALTTVEGFEKPPANLKKVD